MSQLIKFNNNYPIQINLKIQWGDMDAFGHVNNIMYFKYFESVRVTYFNRLGLMDTNNPDSLAPILAETTCRYKLPLYFPDSITVGANISEFHSHGFLMDYAIYSQQLKKISSIGSGRIVLLHNKTHQKIKVTDNIKNTVNSIQNIS